MIEHDSLSSLLLLHWQNHRPAFLGRLQASNQLNATLCETRDRMADLLYDLIAVQKLEHHQAWELMTEQFLLSEESA